MMNCFHCALKRGSQGTGITRESGAVRIRNAAPPGLRFKMKKTAGFLVVDVFVAPREVCTSVELVRERIVVPAAKLSDTMTRPTSAVVKFAVVEVRVATSRVVAPSLKVTPPISQAGASIPE